MYKILAPLEKESYGYVLRIEDEISICDMPIEEHQDYT